MCKNLGHVSSRIPIPVFLKLTLYSNTQIFFAMATEVGRVGSLNNSIELAYPNYTQFGTVQYIDLD